MDEATPKNPGPGGPPGPIDSMTPAQPVIPPIKPLDAQALKKARAHLDRLTKPPGSLGYLEDWVARLVAVRSPHPPRLQEKTVFVFAADHGVAEEGVSAFPQEVTGQMVRNFLAGGAAINVLARFAGVRVQVVDMGVNADLAEHPDLFRYPVGPGTRNFANEWAMTRPQAVQALETGMSLARRAASSGVHILATGDMGIGNTTAAAAMIAALGPAPPAEVTGRGTGIDSDGLNRKIKLIEQALARHQPNPRDPLDVLAKVGGFEIGGIAGLILGAAAEGLPVVVDGVISGAGALLALRLAPACRDYLFPAHRSAEPGARVVLEAFSLPPLLDLQLRLGEGTGAVLGIHLLEAGLKLYTEMATFDDAGVNQKNES